MSKKPTKRRSLLEFVKDNKKAGCPVCALPVQIRGELATARHKKIKRSEALEWLVAEHHIKITVAQMDAHFSGRHEQ